VTVEEAIHRRLQRLVAIGRDEPRADGGDGVEVLDDRRRLRQREAGRLVAEDWDGGHRPELGQRGTVAGVLDEVRAKRQVELVERDQHLLAERRERVLVHDQAHGRLAAWGSSLSVRPAAGRRQRRRPSGADRGGPRDASRRWLVTPSPAPRRLEGMAFGRGIDGGEPARAQPIEARAGAFEVRRAARAFRLPATLACPRCDAPVALGGRAVAFSEQLDCPFCRHLAPLRDFLSLAMPTRPARVEVRATVRPRATRR